MRAPRLLPVPRTLAQALAFLQTLLAVVLVATFGIVLATAHALERARAPLSAATQIRHDVLAAETRALATFLLSPEKSGPSKTATLEARARASRGIEELERMASRLGGETIPPDLVLDLNAAWDERCALADRIFALKGEDRARELGENSELLAALDRYTKSSEAFNQKLQGLIGLLEERSDAVLARLKLAAAAIVAFGFVVLATVTVLVARSIVMPLRRLAAAEKEVALGRLDVEVPVNGLAELGELARSFNEMVRALSTRAAEVAEKQDLLARREKSLDRRNRELAAANAELDAFAYAASHDLRAPLRGIESMARFLWEDAAESLDAEARDKLERIRRAASRLHVLIDSLLEVARAGRELGKVEDVPLGSCIDRALEALDGQIRETGAEVRVQPDLPTVHGDPMRLAQVFQNLIGNAIKYSSGPDRKPLVEVGASTTPAGGVDIWVRDNGIGIPADQHRRIFQIFRRLQREGEYEGTGVGLSIVERIVTAHGGTVSVESAPRNGSRFTVHLPQRVPGALLKEAA